MSEFPERYDTQSRMALAKIIEGRAYVPAEYATELQAKLDRMTEVNRKLRDQVMQLSLIASEKLAEMVQARRDEQ